ncbi:Transporter of the ATP-binding cassette (ABC), partial [Coemansia furcata]
MRDNHAKVGRAVMAISVAQATLLIYAWSHRAKTAYFAHAYLALVTLFAVLIAIANATCLAIYVYSDRMLMSVILLLSYARVQLRPVFTRPPVAGSVANLQPLEYTPVSDVKANHNDDDEVTPLARCADEKPMPLVESHEFNVSWYSMLAFSWVNDILRRGTARQLEATDLYHLSDIDMPTPNWHHYVRHRKPGHSLLVTVLIVFAPELILQAVLSMVNSILPLLGLFFLQRILCHIGILDSSNGGCHGLPAEKSIRSMYLDAFGLHIFTLAASILYNQTMWIGHHIETHLKGLLVTELSSKTLHKDEDEDEDDSAPTALAAADGKIMNLLTANILKAVEDSAHLYKVYPLPLMPFACIWYVYLLFEMCMPVGLSMTILYIQMSKVLFRYLAKVEDTLTEVSEKHIAKITAPLQ